MASCQGFPLRYGPDLRPTARPMLVLVVLGVHALVGWGLLQARATATATAHVVPVFLGLITPATPASIQPTPSESHQPRKAAHAQAPRPTPAAAAPPKPPVAVIAAKPAPAPAPAAALAPGPTPAPVAVATAAAQAVFEPPSVIAKPASPTQPHTPRGVARTDVRYVVQPAPTYPSTSRRLGEVGEVHLRVEIDTDGRARHVSVHRSSGFPRLDESAMAAVRAARFAPFTENGVALVVWTIVPIEFQLES